MELAKFHKEKKAWPCIAAALKSSEALTNDKAFKFEHGPQIPIDEVVEIIESITFDDVPNGNYCAKLI